MRADETELMMVRRHIRDGAGHIAKQRALIARLRQKGLPTEEAEALLVTFEDMQRQHEDHLARVEASGTVSPLGVAPHGHDDAKCPDLRSEDRRRVALDKAHRRRG